MSAIVCCSILGCITFLCLTDKTYDVVSYRGVQKERQITVISLLKRLARFSLVVHPVFMPASVSLLSGLRRGKLRVSGLVERLTPSQVR